jgi:photosystem II stability/assembly factor-like uncharacterized protein
LVLGLRHIVSTALLALLLAHVVSLGFVATAYADDSAHTSAGAVWEHLQFTLDSADLKLRDVKFINSTHGWIVGEDLTGTYGGVVLNTNDGGNSWSLQLNNTSPYHDQICIVDGYIIWITGKSSLYYSLDWGTTWNESAVISEAAGMSFVRFINSTHGWTASMGTLYKTVDSGLNWEEVEGWVFGSDVPRDLHFTSDTTAWAIGFFGIYYTSDGCETWTQKHDRGGWAFSFVDRTEAWAVGDSMLAHMTDGESWNELVFPRRSPFPFLSPYFTDVLFVDENNGWIVGGITDDVHILYTQNGGNDWYEQTTSSQIIARLMAVDFVNTTYGWAVGSDGIIIRTTQGNNLGSRLWNGMTDPVFLSDVAGLLVVVVLIPGVFIYFRRKRTTHS